MKTIAHILVRFRVAIAAVFILLAVAGLFAMQSVVVNSDMTKYLPADMQVKQGMDLASEQFGDTTVFRIMLTDVPEDKKQSIADSFAGYSCVDSVTYDINSDDYNRGRYTLYSVSVSGDSYSNGVYDARDTLEVACKAKGYEYVIDSSITGDGTKDLFPFLVLAVALAMVVLFVLASSWVEPLLMLFTIVIAVLINMGSNLIFPSISNTTNAIAAVLQMALSMDYLIMLMNRYRAERQLEPDSKTAMELALRGGVTAIASSSITTVAGLLCLVLMSFTIGQDLGLVLAKGVFISLICVFTVQPALVIAFDDLLESTKKPYPQPKMKALTSFSAKLRVPLCVLFAVLFAVGFALKGFTNVSFVIDEYSEGHDAVQEVFPGGNQIMVLYPSASGETAAQLADVVEGMEGTDSVTTLGNTIGKQQTAAQLADQAGMDQALVNLLFYDYNKGSDVGALPLSDFVAYLRAPAAAAGTTVAASGTGATTGASFRADYGDLLGDMASSIDSLCDLLGTVEPGSYTAAQLTAAVDKHSVKQDTVSFLYLAYAAAHGSNPAWTMSLDQLTKFLVEDVLTDPLFDSLIGDDQREQLIDARDQVVSAHDQLDNGVYGRFVIETSYKNTSDEMAQYVTQLRAACNTAFAVGEYYLVGTGPMIDEMAASFDGEFNLLTIVTIVAILIIVLLTFRSAAIPVVLVLLIQAAFSYDLLLNYVLGNSIYYVALLVVQSILMGATIDYAILYTTLYREARETMGVRDAIAWGYQGSFRTVCMSGSILVVVTLILGIVNNGITGEVCMVISEGAAISVLLVIFVLPGTLAALDRLVVPKRKRFEG